MKRFKWRGEIIYTYVHLSFIQHKSPEIAMCNSEVTFTSWFDIRISFEDPQIGMLEVVQDEFTTNF